MTALAVAAAVAVLAVFGLASSGSTRARSAPALPRDRLSGPATTLPGLLAAAGGRPVVVVFWASWCGPCEHEAPALERFAESPAGRGRIVGVDWSDALAGARAFVGRYRWTFPNTRDGEGTVGNAFGITGLPTTFVVDSRRRIRRMLRGPQDQISLTRALAQVERS